MSLAQIICLLFSYSLIFGAGIAFNEEMNKKNVPKYIMVLIGVYSLLSLIGAFS